MPVAPVRILNQSRGTTIAEHVEIATSLWARGKGLIGRRALPDGFGLVIRPCGAIHMCGVRMPLEVLHVNRLNRVIKMYSIKPWRFGLFVRGSVVVIELPAGTVERSETQVGDVVVVVDTPVLPA